MAGPMVKMILVCRTCLDMVSRKKTERLVSLYIDLRARCCRTPGAGVLGAGSRPVVERSLT